MGDADATVTFVAVDEFVICGLEREFAGQVAAGNLPFGVRDQGVNLAQLGTVLRLADARGGRCPAVGDGVAIAAWRAAPRLDVASVCAAGIVFIGKSSAGCFADLGRGWG